MPESSDAATVLPAPRQAAAVVSPADRLPATFELVLDTTPENARQLLRRLDRARLPSRGVSWWSRLVEPEVVFYASHWLRVTEWGATIRLTSEPTAVLASVGDRQHYRQYEVAIELEARDDQRTLVRVTRRSRGFSKTIAARFAGALLVAAVTGIGLWSHPPTLATLLSSMWAVLLFGSAIRPLRASRATELELVAAVRRALGPHEWTTGGASAYRRM